MRPATANGWAFGLALAVISTAAVVIAARRIPRPADFAKLEDRLNAAQDLAFRSAPPADAVAPAVAVKTQIVEVPKTAKAQTPRAKSLDMPASPKRSEKSSTSTTLKSTPAMEGLETSAPPETIAIDASTEADAVLPVTITGCLERDRRTFWLKNASGPGVQRVRSWKSGFFKKRASTITLIDPADALGLHTYIGQRVSATGTLVDGELRPRSLQQLSDSCN